MYAYLSLKHFWHRRLLSHMKGAHAHTMLFDKSFIAFFDQLMACLVHLVE